MHTFVLNYNWDDGPDRLSGVIDHPLCDQGTALVVYWLSNPFVAHAPPDASEGSIGCDPSALIGQIESRFLDMGFHHRSIAVDPGEILCVEDLSECEVEAGWDRIPAELKRASPGIPLDVIEL